MTKKITLLIALAIIFEAQAIPSDKCNPETWTTNGTVYSILPVGDKIYIGGRFTQVGPYSGSGFTIDAGTGKPTASFPKINFDVYAACADGKGGWFICGSFWRINDIARKKIAHIMPDGSLDIAWNPNPDDVVNTLTLSGTTLYVGGSFKNIGGQNRGYIAALDAGTGKVLEWNPSLSSVVYSITVSGTTIYAGGTLSERILALDATTGQILNWFPGITGYATCVNTIAQIGEIVFIGGTFDSVGKKPHRNLAAVDATTGKVLDWNLDARGFGIKSFVVNGTTLYIGGYFLSLGGQERNHIAALNATTGEVLPWNPNANGEVVTLALSGSMLYVGGVFDTIGGKAHSKIAAVDAETGKVLDWDPMVWGDYGGQVLTLAKTEETIFVGGRINGIGGVFRKNLAAIDANTGKALDWNPRVNWLAYSLAASNGSIYAGGSFDTVGGLRPYRIVSMDTITGQVLHWNCETNGWVYSIAVSGSIVYAAGGFDTIAGQRRGNIAALDEATGNLLNWNPDADSLVQMLLISGTVIYAGGNFAYIGGGPRRGLAALDMTTGKAQDWNCRADGVVTTLAVNGTMLYAGGNFTSIGGKPSGAIAALNAATGNALAWNPNVTYPTQELQYHYVNTIAGCGTALFVGGYFSGIGRQKRYFISAVEPGNDSALAWDAHIGRMSFGGGESVNSIVVKGTTIYIGGGFSIMDSGFNHPYFARFDTPGPAPASRPSPSPFYAEKNNLRVSQVNSPNGALVRISYSLPVSAHVDLRLYSVSGRKVFDLVDFRRDAGEHSLTLPCGKVLPGVYVAQLLAGNIRRELKISIVR